jgi:hypothetical protein
LIWIKIRVPPAGRDGHSHCALQGNQLRRRPNL